MAEEQTLYEVTTLPDMKKHIRRFRATTQRIGTPLQGEIPKVGEKSKVYPGLEVLDVQEMNEPAWIVTYGASPEPTEQPK